MNSVLRTGAEARAYLLLTHVCTGCILSGMKRTTVFLTEGQVKSLRKLAKRKTITVAQLIRLYVQAGIEGDSK
jgi:predicted DNA-binding ribbon-helix-helix protein